MFFPKRHIGFLVSCALVFLQDTFAGNVAHGGNCSVSNNRLDSATHKLLTDCNDKTFCTLQNTCEPRQCRRDEFPFGYDPGESLPPMCPQAQYCPDEGDACKPLLHLGQACQLNRDDQCTPPTSTPKGVSAPDTNNQSPMAITGLSPMNANGSICLHLTCMYANATLGTLCITDSTVYTGPGPNGQQFSNTVSRDNCVSPGLYCNTTSNVCEKTQQLGLACRNDLECESYNCNVQNICVAPPETPVKVAAWQYVLTSVAVLLAMVGICVLLVLAHKRQRRQRIAETREYYQEQLGYRRSIITLHSVAAKSVYSHSKLGSPDSGTFARSSQSNAYRTAVDARGVIRLDTMSTRRRE